MVINTLIIVLTAEALKIKTEWIFVLVDFRLPPGRPMLLRKRDENVTLYSLSGSRNCLLNYKKLSQTEIYFPSADSIIPYQAKVNLSNAISSFPELTKLGESILPNPILQLALFGQIDGILSFLMVHRKVNLAYPAAFAGTACCTTFLF